MDTKSLLIGIISFIAGGLLVSTAAVTFEKDTTENNRGSKSMSSMVGSLRDKTGDDYDAEFITQMIDHHEGAVEMARLSAEQAKHEEIKELSRNIIAAQEKEIAQMMQWQKEWNYDTSASGHDMME